MVMEQSLATRGRRQKGPMMLYKCVSSQAVAVCPRHGRSFERVLPPQSPALFMQRPRTGQKKRCHTVCDVEAELGGMRPQAKERGGLWAATGSWVRPGHSPKPPEGTRPAHAWIRDLWPPDL